MGGVIAGRKVIVDYIRQKARPNLFSSALTPADTAACLAAVDHVEAHPELVDKLWENTDYCQGRPGATGLRHRADTDAHRARDVGRRQAGQGL